jgi:hypothetical protein
MRQLLQMSAGQTVRDGFWADCDAGTIDNEHDDCTKCEGTGRIWIQYRQERPWWAFWRTRS